MRALALTLICLLSLSTLRADERKEIPLTPDQAVESGIRLGLDPIKMRHGSQVYLVGVDTPEKSRRKTFDGFRIIIQKPRGDTPELTARMWDQEWPEGVFYSSFEIEESFLPYLYVLVDYGKARYEGAFTYKIRLLSYILDKPNNLPEGLKKMMAQSAEKHEK